MRSHVRVYVGARVSERTRFNKLKDASPKLRDTSKSIPSRDDKYRMMRMGEDFYTSKRSTFREEKCHNFYCFEG